MYMLELKSGLYELILLCPDDGGGREETLMTDLNRSIEDTGI